MTSRELSLPGAAFGAHDYWQAAPLAESMGTMLASSRVFERYPGRLAEALDCTVYAVAARTLINTPAVRREAELTGGPVAPPPPMVIRSAWMDGARYKM